MVFNISAFRSAQYPIGHSASRSGYPKPGNKFGLGFPWDKNYTILLRSIYFIYYFVQFYSYTELGPG
jgi:hypothetical protein